MTLCQLLDWDSRFFGRRIARVTPGRLTQAEMPVITDWCRANKIDCLYLLADADDYETVCQASRNGFYLVDVRITFANDRLSGSAQTVEPGGNAMRRFRPDDLPALKEIAGRLHTDSRFFFDPHFSPARSRAMFEIWIETSCLNRDGGVFVAERQQKPVGYVACGIGKDRAGQIELLGVDTPAQGAGLGRRLVNAALEWFAANRVARVSVVTQGRNVAAQRLYQTCGFTTESLQIWYHRWLQSGSDQSKA
jgi:dTDP-4-amino-4,6-dideoxy-D-galactose acyltransferase